MIAVNAVCLLTYIFYTYQFHFHSDSAAANLLAQEIYETGQYFPRDWNWVNGDIWSLFMQTWVLVLLPFFENGFALQRIFARRHLTPLEFCLALPDERGYPFIEIARRRTTRERRRLRI